MNPRTGLVTVENQHFRFFRKQFEGVDVCIGEVNQLVSGIAGSQDGLIELSTSKCPETSAIFYYDNTISVFCKVTDRAIDHQET